MNGRTIRVIDYRVPGLEFGYEAEVVDYGIVTQDLMYVVVKGLDVTAGLSSRTSSR